MLLIVRMLHTRRVITHGMQMQILDADSIYVLPNQAALDAIRRGFAVLI